MAEILASVGKMRGGAVEALGPGRESLLGVAKNNPLITDDFYQDPFSAAPVKLTIKNLFPRSEIQLAPRYGHHHLPAHDLPLHMGVGVVFPHVVAVLGDWCMGGQLLQPDLVAVMQPGLIVIDEDAGGDVHGID